MFTKWAFEVKMHCLHSQEAEMWSASLVQRHSRHGWDGPKAGSA